MCSSRSTPKPLLAAAVAAAGLALAAPAAAQDLKGEPAGRVSADSVMVKLKAWTLGFRKAEVQAGSVTFRVENVGNAPHSLAIEGQGTDKRVEGLILPHQAKTVAFELKPGEYRLYCPVKGHAGKGMEATLKVTE